MPSLGSRSLLSLAMMGVLLASSCLVAAPAGAQQAEAPPRDETKAAATEFALRGEREARAIKYGDWQKFCFKTPGSALVCRTTISGRWDTGQTAVRIDLIDREGDSTARLQMFLPVGLYLQTGAVLKVDEGQPVRIPYVWCLTNSCIAGDRADPMLIRQMETGQQLKLAVADTNLLSVTTSIPLEQFAAARGSAPTRTFTQEIDE